MKRTFIGMIMLGALLALGGCATAPDYAVLKPVASAAQGARSVEIIALTNRRASGPEQQFGAERTYTLSRQALTLSIPPGHVPGQIEWPTGASGDPARAFVVRSEKPLDDEAFRATLSRLAGKRGEALLFVHGFNTSYQEAVFRLAQISADSGFDGANVLFSWPSAGNVTGYLRDRESAMFSRDRLEQVVRAMAATPGMRKINIMAHSMGTWLTVEMLRQAKIRGDLEFGGKLGYVLLASPDIDSQVFQSQIDVIGKRNPPIAVFVSRNDAALKLSSRLAGDIPRVGNVALDDPKVKQGIERAGLTVVDLTAVQSTDRLNHTTFAAAPAVIQNIGQHLNASGAGRAGQSSPGVFVVDTAASVLSAPARLLESVTGR